MSPASASTDHQIRAITLDGQKFFVCLRVGYDGIEHVGRLRFTDAKTETTYQDHAAIPGISALDAVRKAKEFSPKEIEARCHRALSEKRRFGKLRSATDRMIEKNRSVSRSFAWSLEGNGREIRHFAVRQDPDRKTAYTGPHVFAPDGSAMAEVDDREDVVWVWDRDGNPVAKLEGAVGDFVGWRRRAPLAFAPDG